MTEAVIVALITAVGAIIAELIINRASSKELYARLDKQSEISDAKLNGRMDVMETQLRALREQFDEIAKSESKTYELERRMSVVEERISDIHHRINELRDDAK